MKAVNAEIYREMPLDELRRTIVETEETLTRNRFQLSLGQLQSSATIKTMRKNIARMKTVLRQRELSGN
jgi:large subunit ribosomal protein L29